MGYKRLLHRRVYHLAGLGIVDALFFGLTDPAKATLGLFLVAFILVTLSLYYLFRAILAIPALYGLKDLVPGRLALTLTLCSSGLLALQSIGQLSVKDLAVIVPLVVLGYFYFTYNQRQLRSSG